MYTIIRYRLIQRDVRYLYTTSEFKPDGKTEVLLDYQNPIFVNILERIGDNPMRYKIKLFYANGTTIEGWTLDNMLPIEITNMDELFDGRFNQ